MAEADLDTLIRSIAKKEIKALASAAKVRDLLAVGRDTPLGGVGISQARAEELVAEVRAGRDSR